MPTVISGFPDLWLLGVIAIVAAALRLGLHLTAPVFFEGDARGYLVRAMEITLGDGFQFSLKRTPGYPVFLAGVFQVAGLHLESVAFAQHLLGIATALLAYDAARRIAGRGAGLLAGLATAASGSMIIYERVILTESLFTFLLLGEVWLLLVGLQRRSTRLLVVAGVVAGVGALIRPVGLAVPLVLPLVVLWLRPDRRGVLLSSAYLLAFGLVIGPWMLRNSVIHGEAEVVHPGRFLIERTITNNETGVLMFAGPDLPQDPARIRSGRAVLHAIELERPDSFEVHSALVRRLRLTDAQASDLMWDLAINAISRQPMAYLTGTWIELGQLVMGERELVRAHIADRRSSWKGAELTRLVRNGSLPNLLPAEWDEPRRDQIAHAITQVYQPSNGIVPLLIGLLAATIWGIRDAGRRSVLVPVVLMLSLGACTLVINGAFPRYRYPLDPLLHIAAAAGLMWTITTLRQRLAQRPIRPMAAGL